MTAGSGELKTADPATKVSAPASRAMFDAARAAGITHFDTAHVYTGGGSERLLGGFVAGDRALQVATTLGYDGAACVASLHAYNDLMRRAPDQANPPRETNARPLDRGPFYVLEVDRQSLLVLLQREYETIPVQVRSDEKSMFGRAG